MPVLRESYEDTLAAAEGADLLVSHALTFTTRLVAEKKGIPWASTMLHPIGFLSAYDPPVLPRAVPGEVPVPGSDVPPACCSASRNGVSGPGASRGTACGPRLDCRRRRKTRCSRASTPRRWCWRCSRRFSPPSNRTGRPRRSSPASPSTIRTARRGCRLSWSASSIAARHPSCSPSARRRCWTPGNFYEDSAAAAKILGRRAVLLVGKDTRNRPPSLPDGVVAFDYAPFSELFPRAAAIVHQGGIGTTAQAMRSGRPMLVMPYAHDQPDNAERLVRLGIARSISRHRYTPDRAASRVAAPARQPGLLGAGRATRASRSSRRMGCGRLARHWNPCSGPVLLPGFEFPAICDFLQVCEGGRTMRRHQSYALFASACYGDCSRLNPAK